MPDWEWRTAYLPSISVCNDAAYTLTHVAFDPDLAEDIVVIGGRQAEGRDLQRVQQLLDGLRRVARVTSRARVLSTNVARAKIFGKGLGSSASGSAALALAGIAALFGEEATRNLRFVSCMARLLSGSGGRSVVGGVGLWLSYPGIDHEDSFAVRIDSHHLGDLRLITVPINSQIGLKTEDAHREAPASPFYKSWMLSRAAEVLRCCQAVRAGDWRTVGQLGELDSIRVHGITMSAGVEHKLFAWEPENISLFRMCNDLRGAGTPVYCSTDTGPTAVFLTDRAHEVAVVEAIRRVLPDAEIIQGNIAGPARLVDAAEALQALVG